jgi:polyphosphate kinase
MPRYLNRELSYLQFTSRVLNLAEDHSLPLLERAKFLAIAATNLDEFYMVRVAGLKRQRQAGLMTLSADGLTANQQLDAIAETVVPLMKRCSRLFANEVLPALKAERIRILRWDDLSKSRQREMASEFQERIFPILTPLAVDPGHPFPFISNRSLNLAVHLLDRLKGTTHFARVKVPPLLPRLLRLPESEDFVPIEDVIAANLEDLFPGMKILDRHVFRVTRDRELEMDDEDEDDLLSALERELTRRRFSRAVRLEVEQGISEQVCDRLVRELQIEQTDVVSLPGPLDLSLLMELYALRRPELKYPAFQPRTHPDLAAADDNKRDIFAVLRARDILVHHPYDSFTTSTQAFIEQAGRDPNVLAIKQTLYRTSGESPIVDALIEAAEAGKQVVVLVEIKARFDEIANINWARTLERAGCHVVYGLVGLKTHCKLSMVVRQEAGGLRRYVHIGTGNYNPTTAGAYEDLGLLTADVQLGSEVGHLFNYLTGYSRRGNYNRLIVAPHEMRERVIDLIEREAAAVRDGRHGRIIFKLNSLVDEAIINALYAASEAGVSIDIICRGICCLRPSPDGPHPGIRVKSIVGRYLEHSRIYYFGAGGADEIYIGSADMMHRNLDRRVEALVRVEDSSLKARLIHILDSSLSDNSGSWTLNPDGEWERLTPPPGEVPRDLQGELMRDASPQ